MSLQGLDDRKVKQARDAAVAESGGWLLLKYASRDELKLLATGTEGIVEMRHNITQYEDPSPLFGLLRYRRKLILVKYLPEDCSRLIQARMTVHFKAFCDHFSPHDSTLTIASAKELRDTTLSAACSLHAASGSLLSSTSLLRGRTLMEITEEEEEEERERKRPSMLQGEYQRPKTAGAVHLGAFDATQSLTLVSSHPTPGDSALAGYSHLTRSARPASPSKSFDDSARRSSSQSARANPRPKVLLAPRLSDTSTISQAPGNGDASRIISSLPPGFKVGSKAMKKVKSHGRREEGILDETEKDTKAASNPTLEAETLKSVESERPGTRNGPAEPVRPKAENRLAALKSPPTSIKPKMTAEQQRSKARLMKAMEQRKKKQMGKEALGKNAAPEADVPRETAERSLQAVIFDEGFGQDISAAQRSAAGGQPTTGLTGALLDKQALATKADSAIGIDVGNDQASFKTGSDSHPNSPDMASFDDGIAHSTKPSSVSESTEETPRMDGDVTAPSAENAANGELRRRPNVEKLQHGIGEAENTAQESSVVQTDEAEPADWQSAEQPSGPAEAMGAEEGGSKQANSPTSPSIDRVGGAKGPMSSSVLPISKFSTISSAGPKVSIFSKKEAGVQVSGTATVEASPGYGIRPPLKMPVSRFSTKENKSPSTTGPTRQSVPTMNLSALVRNNSQTAIDSFKADGKDTVKPVQGKAKDENENAVLGPVQTDQDVLPDDAGHRHSATNFLDDEALMEELQSATVEEAKPVKVSKSALGLMPVPNQDQGGDVHMAKRPATSHSFHGDGAFPHLARIVSNPIKGLVIPGYVSTSSARSVSSGAAYLHKITQQQSADLRPKTSKIGSSISQRIKALEKVSSSGEAGSLMERPASAIPNSSFLSVRRPSPSSSLGRPRSPSVFERTCSFNQGWTPSPPQSTDSTTSNDAGRVLKRDWTSSTPSRLTSRLSVFERGKSPKGRAEAIQVTARILRDPGQQAFPKGPEPKPDLSQLKPLDLKQSPLVVDHTVLHSEEVLSPALASVAQHEQQTPASPSPNKRRSLLQRRFSSKKGGSQSEELLWGGDEIDNDAALEPPRRSSLNVVKEFIRDYRDGRSSKSASTDNLSLLSLPPSVSGSRSPSRPSSNHQSGGLSGRVNRGNRHSSMDPKSPLSSGQFSEDEDASSVASLKSPTPAKSGGSRASRLMRRLSTTLTSSRKSPVLVGPSTVTEEYIPETEAAGDNIKPPAILVDMGDINCLNPDNLLWRHRIVKLDVQGFLRLSAVPGLSLCALGANTAKRYHMSEFRPPYVSPIEDQEMPNSVVLDFRARSGLQFSCLDRREQMTVLNVLRDAHERFGDAGGLAGE